MRLTSGRVQVALVGTLLIGSFMLGGYASSSGSASASPAFCSRVVALLDQDFNTLGIDLAAVEGQTNKVVSTTDIEATASAARQTAKGAPTKALADELNSLASELEASNGDPTRVTQALGALTVFYGAFEQQCPALFKATPKATDHEYLPEQIVQSAVIDAAREGRLAGPNDVALVLVRAGVLYAGLLNARVSVTRPLGSISGRPQVVEFSVNTGTGATSQCVLVPEAVDGVVAATPCP